MPHHIVLVSLDALRPDRIGFLGNQRPVSPNLDRIAGESAVFLNATSPTTWTLPGHMSMLSGLGPLLHNCVSARHRFPPEELPFPLLFELLAEGGFVPLAVTGGGYMEGQFGFGRGLDQVHVIYPIMEALEAVRGHLQAHDRTFTFFHTYTVHDYPRVATRPGALDLAHQRDPDYQGFFPTDRDFHALLNAMAASPEVPEVTPRDTAFLEDLYDSAVRASDAALGGFMKQLDQDGLWDDTTLIITSDHGESLGESHAGRRYWSHSGPPYQEQIQVPLIVRPAYEARGLFDNPIQVRELASLIDLAPTILDLAGVPYQRDRFEGASLIDLCLGQVAAFETRSLFFHSCEDTEDRYLDPGLFGTAMTWKRNGKLFYDHRSGALREYYLLDSDPGETDNRIDDLGQEELKRVGEAIVAYQDRVKEQAYSPEAAAIEDPVVLERLAQLGYIEEP